MPPPTDLTAVELDALVGVVPPEELTMGSPRGESGNFTHNVDRVHAINYENEVLLAFIKALAGSVPKSDKDPATEETR